jgi:hypothetical protein
MWLEPTLGAVAAASCWRAGLRFCTELALVAAFFAAGQASMSFCTGLGEVPGLQMKPATTVLYGLAQPVGQPR